MEATAAALGADGALSKAALAHWRRGGVLLVPRGRVCLAYPVPWLASRIYWQLEGTLRMQNRTTICAGGAPCWPMDPEHEGRFAPFLAAGNISGGPTALRDIGIFSRGSSGVIEADVAGWWPGGQGDGNSQARMVMWGENDDPQYNCLLANVTVRLRAHSLRRTARQKMRVAVSAGAAPRVARARARVPRPGAPA